MWINSILDIAVLYVMNMHKDTTDRPDFVTVLND